MNYYNEIKEKLIDNEIYNKVKDYSKNKSDLETYYNVGKLLSEAGKHYGEGVIDKYSKKLILEVGKKYSKRTLFRIRQYYLLFNNEKVSPLATQLNWAIVSELLIINDIDKINYYIKVSIEQNLSKIKLREKIKSNEYERLDSKTIEKLKLKEESKIEDFIKNPILIRNSYNYNEISEKILKKLILEDIDNFLIELGEGFCYIKNEYKIKLGDRYNYIDLLLFNYIYNAFVVIELKVTELNKYHISQIESYMNYIDKNIKGIDNDKTIGIIICKKDNKFVMEYCSDDRIFRTTYEFN